ncbi:N-acetyl-1-D-myo-inositol-2-amino-2-deoxy-alpha-D-glucopyranoside deacetylase [Corynebacterium terpenotabidum]|uniref:1D-myo-inositol 2-acetamido-2-deoxy-alpha-D-glucopyranoside deacetylase n=1 Tax=Corynebacterium terpenotabidum Y-11 TaxID=1200352 RepID=S4XKQ9_9CORY|nr:N-acetyl-1-D-myo-inositol-2-amino-2-deoxy-alpha-D-glucopyranoside deacetylase [Corynebacterium terpenotabidum]AGP31173.1 MshB deacetylase [Corynebacterium terpenotabidum Y-11]
MTVTGPATEDLVGLRVLAVHAHPDDESLWTGLALTQWARRGADVTVVTCTLGEEGEVIGEKYQALIADRSGLLGGYRIAELQRALAALGVNVDDLTGCARPRFLGGVATWRDSGMAGTPPAADPRAFVRSGDAAVDALVDEIERYRPHVLVTYGPDGGYGHPDHIRAHEVTHSAVAAQVAGRRWVPARIWWCVTETEVLDAGLAELRRAGDPPAGWRWPEPGELASVPARQVDARVVGTAADLAAKQAAMSAHATQLWVADGRTYDVIADPRTGADGAPVPFCLSNLITQPLVGTESYTLGERRDGESGLSTETLDRLDCLFAEGR